MNAPKRPINIHAAYHAHVYFDQESLDSAVALCQKSETLFAVKMGRVHQRNVGPHPMWSCQLSFDADVFDGFIPWMDEQRGALSVLVHGLSGNDLADHTDHAYWLGQPRELNLSMFYEKWLVSKRFAKLNSLLNRGHLRLRSHHDFRFGNT